MIQGKALDALLSQRSESISCQIIAFSNEHLALRTRWETLLQLLCLLGIFKDEGIKIPLTPNLELDAVCLIAFLYSRSCLEVGIEFLIISNEHIRVKTPRLDCGNDGILWNGLQR